jgi:peptidoglycan lytic transglycosylase
MGLNFDLGAIVRSTFSTSLLLGTLTAPLHAADFHWFFKHVHATGKCGEAQEIAVSYYWDGHRTASGEKFNPNGLTAAHRSLPFGSLVHLTNPSNGRSVTVRINDRGPFGSANALGVKFDITRGAARLLGMQQTSWLCADIETQTSKD